MICLTNQLEIFHRAVSKVYSVRLSSISIPLLLKETHLPVLKIILKHQALSCFRRVLCLFPELLNLSVLGSKLVISRIKKNPSGDHIAYPQKKKLLSLREPLILCPPIFFTPQSSLEYLPPNLTATALAHSTLNKSTRMYRPVDLSLLSLDGWHRRCMLYDPNAIAWIIFIFWADASSFTAKTHFLEYGLVRSNSPRRLGPFQLVLLRTPNRLFSFFHRLPHISGQDPSKISGFMRPHFPTAPF